MVEHLPLSSLMFHSRNIEMAISKYGMVVLEPVGAQPTALVDVRLEAPTGPWLANQTPSSMVSVGVGMLFDMFCAAHCSNSMSVWVGSM